MVQITLKLDWQDKSLNFRRYNRYHKVSEMFDQQMKVTDKV